MRGDAAQSSNDRLYDTIGGFLVSPGKQNDELIAAEAGDDVGCPHALLERARQDQESPITEVMTKPVVDRLEVVEVKQE